MISIPEVSPKKAFLILATLCFLLVGELWLPWRTIAEGDLLAYFPSLYRPPWDGLWNPMVTLGAPHLPNPQTGVFYPPAWLLAFNFNLALPLYAFVHFFGGALGMWALSHHSLGPRLGPLLAGIAYGLCGPGWSLMTKLDKMPGYTFLPWALVGISWLLSDRGGAVRARGWLTLTMSLALIMLGGSVEGIVTAGLAVGGWALLGQPRGLGQGLVERLTRTGIGSALGLAMGACVIIPFVIVIPMTMRSAGLTFEQVMSRSTHIVDLSGWILHNPLWDVASHSPLNEDGGKRPRFLHSLYGGLPLLLLILPGLKGFLKRPEVLASSLGAFLFMGMALGDQNPLYVWAYHNLPFVDGIRYPEKWWLGALPFQAWLIAWGWEQVEGDRALRRLWAGLSLAAVAVLATLAWMQLTPGDGLWRNLPGATWAPTAAAALFVVVVIAGGRGLLRPGLATALIIGITGMDLITAERKVFPFTDPQRAYAPSTAMIAMTAGLPEGALPPLLWDEDLHQPTRNLPPPGPGMPFYRQMHDALYPNTGVPHGVAYVYGMYAFRMLRPHLFTQHALTSELQARHALIRRTGATHWRMWSAEGAMQVSEALGLLPVGSRVKAGPEPGLLLEPSPLPRLRWVGRVHHAASVEDALNWLSDAPPDDGIVLVAGDRGQHHLASLPEARPGELERIPPPDVRAYRLGSAAWEIQWSAAEDGAFLLAQSWSPGWEFSLDDAPFEDAIPSDTFMMAAPAPAGRHTLILRYIPRGLLPGSLISLLALVATALIARWELRRG